MRIKHFQGYGLVNATKMSKTEINDDTLMVIKVKGNHECGLEPRYYDTYTVKRWLLDKFDKAATNINPYLDIKYKVDTFYEDGVEIAVYSILYGKDVVFNY